MGSGKGMVRLPNNGYRPGQDWLEDIYGRDGMSGDEKNSDCIHTKLRRLVHISDKMDTMPLLNNYKVTRDCTRLMNIRGCVQTHDNVTGTLATI